MIQRLRALLEVGKLKLSGLAVFAVVAGLYLGAGGDPGWRLLAGTTAGTLLIAIAGAAFNMVFEQEADRRMPRTAGRPLPTGRLTTRQVVAFASACAAAGTVALAVTTNALATVLCLLIFVTYVLVYTPMKRRTSLNTLVGAIPGALPPVVGYAAASGRVDQRALVLFAILFCWQVPHFLAIAWRYRADYAAGGMQMLPVVDPEGRSTSRQMVAYCAALIAASLGAYVVGLAGQLYVVVALFLGAWFLATTVLAAVQRRDAAMRLCFVTSIVYLPLLLATMVLDRPH